MVAGIEFLLRLREQHGNGLRGEQLYCPAIARTVDSGVLSVIGIFRQPFQYLTELQRHDLVTSAAHDYGIFWMEQSPNHQWTKHDIRAPVAIDVSRADAMPVAVAADDMRYRDPRPAYRDPQGVRRRCWPPGVI